MQPAIVRQVRPERFDLLNLYRANPARYPFLLESVAKGPLGRYDILFAFPQAAITLSPEGVPDFFKSDFLHRWQYRPQVAPVADIPFLGGFFVFFAYEYAQVVEPTLKLPVGTGPLAQLVHCPAAIIVDHLTDSITLVAEPGAESLLELMQADLAVALDVKATEDTMQVVQIEEEAPQRFLAGVARIRDYIYAGDVFQVNLSRAWQAQVKATAAALYERLRRTNPAPFAALADFGDWQIISSSPERLLRFDGTWLETRPIAGTRKRGDTPEADARLKAELLETVKERAEHIMLIDLERNDLGRICEPGTVEVNELMVLESYRHVHHIVSNVRGRPRAGLNPLQQLEALFPGGTITGCPKVRCMEIIAELEAAPRHAYTGSLGYISWDGRMDLNILIRTLVHQGDTLTFRAGAGIVADAQAQMELKETRHKAEGLLRALR